MSLHNYVSDIFEKQAREMSDNGFLASAMAYQTMPNRAFQPRSAMLMRAHQIDEMCRFIFPVLFSMFNFSYWVYYLFVV
jgi:hypothetical protein